MASKLLEKTRRLNRVLQKKGNAPVSFAELAALLKETLEANVYIVDIGGDVLGSSFYVEEDSAVIVNQKTGRAYLPSSYSESLNEMETSVTNLTGEELLAAFDGESATSHKFLTVLPIFGNSRRLGSIMLARADKEFTDEDLILSEIAATVVGMEIIRANAQAKEIDDRKLAIVNMAIDTLSYSEQEAVHHIFRELKGDEGTLIASRIADRAGITRSVIVNALRKFESAGVIETRSLGMKGTRIKILNNKLKQRLNKVKSE